MTTRAIFVKTKSFVHVKLVFLLSPQCENLPKTSLEACKELLHIDKIQALNGSLKLRLDPGCVVLGILVN
jgi:hypothetical protein